MSETERSVLRMVDRDFQHDVLEKLSRMEARVKMLLLSMAVALRGHWWK
jgi:hypothetical protein